MARWKLGALPALALLMLVSPAAAQFGSIFGPPPRPPRDVGPPDYPVDPRLPVQPRYDRRDEAPEPPPPPLTRLPPPQGAPAPGSVQRQALPPPPGGTAAPEPASAPTQDGRPPAGPNPLPGLPPGQRQPRGTPGQAAPAAPAPNDEVVVAPPKQRIVNQTAVFSGLDKITGRIISFDVAIDETVQFGALRLTPRACYTRPPSETPNTDGFVEVDEITLQGEVKRIFTGWMFAASPGLHGIEHPIYDVWLTDCKSDNPQVVSTDPPPQPASAPAPQAATPPAAPPPPRPNPSAPPRR